MWNRPAEIATTPSRAQTMSVEDIQRAVCHHFHLRSIDLTSKDRHKSVAFARHVAMYLCKQRLKCSFPEIGRAFGNRDHTTVMHADRKINQLLAERRAVFNQVSELTNRIKMHARQN